MIKRVVQPAAGGESFKIQCAIRKMRSIGLNCLFYFCIDYFLHFSRGGANNYRGGATFSGGVQLSQGGANFSQGGAHPPTKSGHVYDTTICTLYWSEDLKLDLNSQ